jgi:MFS family permease
MLCATFAIGVIASNSYPLFINKLGWTNAQLAVITGGLGLAFGGLCAGATGFLVDIFGRRAVAAVASCALAGGWIVFSQLEPYWHSHMLVYFAAFWEAGWQAVWLVALYSLCMDLSSPRVAGSQFAAYMALSNFSTTLGYQFGARILDKLGGVENGFVYLYIVMAGVQLAATLLLLPIDRTELRRALERGNAAKRGNLGLVAFLVLIAFLIAMTIKKTIDTVG